MRLKFYNFYTFFWCKIKNVVIDSIRYAIENGEMSYDQCSGVLSLIPTKDKDISMLKNWYPLALLNFDYKIYAKTLATWLQNVLPMLISQDPSGCIKGRSTFNNIRSTIDVINYANEKKHINGIIAYIDFEKAFDMVNWDFMYMVMEKINFGNNFVHNFKIILNNMQSCIIE